MNRTREQWDAICPKAVAKTASPAAVMYLIQDALSDIAKLHSQADQLRAEVEALRWDRKVCREEFREFRRAADETERELREPDPLIETCNENGHRYVKLPDHPMRNGSPRCPHCMAIGLDKAREEIGSVAEAALGAILAYAEGEDELLVRRVWDEVRRAILAQSPFLLSRPAPGPSVLAVPTAKQPSNADRIEP